MLIVLPWPDLRLTPNSKRRNHWRKYQPAARADRDCGWALTLKALRPAARRLVVEGDEKIAVQISFYPPDRRHRDDDGMIGAFKHMRDGIADALRIDDRRFRPLYLFEDAAPPGRVEVLFCDFPVSVSKSRGQVSA